VPGTLSVYAERITGGNILDYDIKRREAARYGLSVGDVQDIIMSAVGGMNITQTVEGLERYPNVPESIIVMLSVPFSLTGGRLSVAVKEQIDR
jgi:Cu/Ag efflux pump CusA